MRGPRGSVDGRDVHVVVAGSVQREGPSHGAREGTWRRCGRGRAWEPRDAGSWSSRIVESSAAYVLLEAERVGELGVDGCRTRGRQAAASARGRVDY